MPIKNILVVEDSPTDLKYLTDLLAKNGYQVITAQNADEALAKAKQKAAGIACVNSLKQLTLCWLMYAHDNNDSLAITKENLAATYTLASVKYKVTGSGEQDVTNDPNWVEQCEKDDQAILKADFTMEIKDLGTQCSPSSSGTSTWSLSGSKITIDGDEYTIKSLSKGSLVCEESYTQSGITWTFTTTFSRK